MTLHNIIKDFGKKALVISGLVAILSGCGDTNIEQYQRRNIFEDINKDKTPDLIYLQPNRKQTRKQGIYIYKYFGMAIGIIIPFSIAFRSISFFLLLN